MKMSLCNTFRLFAVSTTIVLSIVGSPLPELVNHQSNIATRDVIEDLEHQESITVELKSDLKRPNDINNINLNNAKDDINSIQLDSERKKITNKGPYQMTVTTEKVVVLDIEANGVNKTTSVPLELNTQPITVTTVLNMTMVSQQTNITKKVENTSPMSILETTENLNSIQQGRSYQDNNTTNENQTEVITTVDAKPSAQDTLSELTNPVNNNTKSENILKSLEFIVNTNTTVTELTAKPMETSSSTSGVTTPTWKKYTTIERKRVPTTTPTDESSTSTDTSIYNAENLLSTMSELSKTVQDTSEVMVKSESAQGRITLEDAITSDIPSLEKLKSDLLSFPKITTKSDSESTTPLLLTERSVTETDLTTLIISTFPSTLNSELLNTVSSKRAGYLDLSLKNTTIEDQLSLKPNDTDFLQGPYEADALDQSPDEKPVKKIESQSQLDEDAIKEELLKEEMLSDNEEISKRLNEERKNNETNSAALLNPNKVNITLDDKFMQSSHTAPDDNLSVRPINSDKVKNTVLYPVNPNYKPLKKIEVQPAKPFVRDPDDNSWRNESLSSLGIVFKPKNSSKPFTQVLKNKTENEWNNLPEKDRKSEVPDLRVRLEQIAQKRKSKKKKIDSLGNVYYTDYEESSSSEENTTIPQVEDPSRGTVSTTDISTMGITIVTPVQNTSLLTSTASIPEAMEVPALTTTPAPKENTPTTPKKEPAKVSTQKLHKMFNLFDYYEANDDEDITDYLNMAKIDLKKYTIPIHTTYTPYTSPPLPILYTNPMTQYTPERKGTIQYFPPRTTKRPRKHKHNNMREKINSVQLTDSPKHVLPISYHKLTTSYDPSMYYTNSPDMARLKEEFVPNNFDRNLYLTTPPLTTLPDEDVGVITNEDVHNRPNYAIKHYKDYMNEANQEQEHNKHGGYPFTEPPAHDSITDYIKPTAGKDKTTVTEDYDYETQFRKDLLDRFVANFNEKSNRFKSDFPVVYNNSIVHGPSYDDKDVAMSRAYFRRPYSNQEYKPLVHDPYDPNCENVTVELSPAYELHYYVPDQEEKQEVEAKPINLPVRYRL